jgi:hypothetical protein
MKGKMVRAAHSVGGDSCEYSTKKRRAGIEIVVECGDCKAEPGLENARCFKSVLTAMQREGTPVAVTLRSHVERRYGSAAVQTMSQISGILNRVESLQSQLARDSTKSAACADCLHPLAGKLSMVGRGLGSMDLNSAISVANTLDSHDFPKRSGCADCIGITRVQVTDIAKGARNLEKSLVRGAFNIVEGD